MTTKVLSTYVASYTLAAQYDTLSITASGRIGAGGLTLNHVSTVENAGNIRGVGHDGVHATAAVEVVNGAGSTIVGYSGVFDQAAGTVLNFGAIAGQSRYGNGVFLVGGGQVTNGGPGGSAASIQGQNVGVLAGAAASVLNYGAISGINGDGVYLEKGGRVTNGSAATPAASIVGANVAVHAAGSSATVTNFGTLRSAPLGSKGVDLAAGGAITNAAGGLISAGYAVYGAGAAVTVLNQGYIHGRITAVELRAVGAVTNAAGGLIEGGVYLYAGGSVANLGSIQGAVFVSYGTVTNGSVSDTGAAITSLGSAVIAVGAASSIVNFALIEAATNGSYDVGVKLAGDESLVNGSSKDTAALIGGGTGVVTTLGDDTVCNYGTICGVVGAAVDFQASGDTVRNYGSICGAEGVAVDFQTSGDTLIAEAGCVFEGQAQGGGGTLLLDNGKGSVAQLFGPGGMIVYGSMSATVFDDFGTLSIGKKAKFTVVGAASVGAADTLVVAGALTVAKALVNAGLIETAGGTVTLAGAVTGSGTAQIDGGTLDFQGAFNEAVAFTGSRGTLELAQSQGYAATITGFSKSGGTALDLADIAFGGSTTASFSGGTSGGTLTVTDGVHTAHLSLVGNYKNSSFQVASDGHGGTSVTDPKAPAPIARAFVQAMANLGQPADGGELAHRGDALPRLAGLAAPRHATA